MKPKIYLPPERYQPKKQKLLENVSIDTTPDELAESVLRPVKVVYAKQAHSRKSD